MYKHLQKLFSQIPSLRTHAEKILDAVDKEIAEAVEKAVHKKD